VLIVALVVGGALFGIGGAILAAPVVAAGRDLYRYTFARLSQSTAVEALAMVFHTAGADDAAAPTPDPPAAVPA
jgi:hypothetical protein